MRRRSGGACMAVSENDSPVIALARVGPAGEAKKKAPAHRGFIATDDRRAQAAAS